MYPYYRAVLRSCTRRILNRMKNRREANKLAIEAYYSNPATRNSAANVLWRFWRQRRHMSLPKVVKRFQDAKLMSTDIRQMRFDDLVIFLRRPDTIRYARALLRCFHHRAQCLHEQEGTAGSFPPGDGLVNVRVFLAMYMIVTNTSKVFESMGDLEHALLRSGRRLMANFERLILQFTARNHEFCKISADAVASLLPSLFDYLRKFKAWKVPDELKLTLRIENALFCLHYAILALPGGREQECNARLAEEMDTQTQRLRSKLIQIAGQARLTEFDLRLANGEGGSHATMPTGDHALPPLHIALDLDVWATKLPAGVKNEQLAHYLLLDPAFALLPYDHDKIKRTGTNPLHDIYWNEIEADLKGHTISYTRMLKCVEQIGKDLQELSGGHQIDQIKDALNVVHIEERIKANAFDWTEVVGLGSTIILFIKRFQPPADDDSLRQKWTVVRSQMEEATNASERAEAFTAMLRLAIDSIGKIRIGMANTRFFLFFFYLTFF